MSPPPHRARFELVLRSLGFDPNVSVRTRNDLNERGRRVRAVTDFRLLEVTLTRDRSPAVLQP